eukprot:CAMPEP_0119365020 /NCGR_PEP_ID=MMETSP1334-20130426/11950_1 /TAXON_ID=127549 /ORGANISM="Calcidiscus leptoporus, Strain RCC1130" /LENGTH=145 /DNA_ID=CAMNT_0007380875 /DNA_START=110 /DNA_END=545 /DNA_ORIENTATION=+
MCESSLAVASPRNYKVQITNYLAVAVDARFPPPGPRPPPQHTTQPLHAHVPSSSLDKPFYLDAQPLNSVLRRYGLGYASLVKVSESVEEVSWKCRGSVRRGGVGKEEDEPLRLEPDEGEGEGEGEGGRERGGGRGRGRARAIQPP